MESYLKETESNILEVRFEGNRSLRTWSVAVGESKEFAVDGFGVVETREEPPRYE